MDEMNNIVLTDENGNELEFEFLDMIEYNGGEYVVLVPVEEGDGADQVVILKVEADDDNEETVSYVTVENEETLDAIFEIFKENFKDEFNFVD